MRCAHFIYVGCSRAVQVDAKSLIMNETGTPWPTTQNRLYLPNEKLSGPSFFAVDREDSSVFISKQLFVAKLSS